MQTLKLSVNKVLVMMYSVFYKEGGPIPHNLARPLMPHSSPGGPSPHNMARALMPRQPYSAAVPSTGGRLHPLVPEVSVPYKGNRRGRKDY